MTLEARDKLMSLTDVLAGPLGRSPAPMSASTSTMLPSSPTRATDQAQAEAT